jgi:predicted ribosome quality control (RQC) complex YloA/Tae2 family protein
LICGRRTIALVSSKGRGFRVVECEGFEILVGKGDSENDRLTFGIAEPRDLWLHVSGPAGSHVIVRNPEGLALQGLPRAVVERAAGLAAWHSKARGARGKVEVHVCRVADVRKPKGFAPGQVLLKRWDVVKVHPKGEAEPGAGDSAPDAADEHRPRGVPPRRH